MTNLDIIKYLAHNNPDRLAEFLDDIYCIGWNCGAYEQRHIDDDDTSAVDIDFVESKWLDQKAGEDFFLDDELKEWSEFADWISVEDRLPESKINCLVHYKHAYCDDDEYWAVRVSFYDGNEFQIGLAYKVTHWMYLPSPPKKEG